MSDKEVQGFVTVDGRTLAVRPIDTKFALPMIGQGIRAKHARSGAPLEPPTYTVTTASGATETHAHDETTLETDADKAAWAAYQAALKALNDEIVMGQMRFMLMEGLVYDDPPQEWAERYAFYGMEMPDSPQERTWLYIQTVLLPTASDLERALAAVMAVSATGNEEAVKAAEALFRHSLEGATATLDPTPGG